MAIEEVIKRMIHYFGDDVRRINHALKVYGFASSIARSEQLLPDELFIVDCVAILHDIGIKEAEKKHHSSGGKYQEMEGPPVARAMLSGLISEGAVLDRICYIIGNHHSYQRIDGVDFQIIVEADFLVNIFEDEIGRTAVQSVRKKYFKTGTGSLFLESMYVNKL